MINFHIIHYWVWPVAALIILFIILLSLPGDHDGKH